jgi:ABC-type Fe3+/spermidine/putrescine transport system ATPase subunit
VTTIYVTHDQEEALSLSDQVVVMERGRVQHVGRPEDVYLRPANRFVAEFVGQANLLSARVEEAQEGGVRVSALGMPLAARLPDERRPERGVTGLVMVRPEQVRLSAASEAQPGGAWQATATVLARGFHGAYESYWLALTGVDAPWLVDVPLTPDAASGVANGGDELAPGSTVTVAAPGGVACWLW